MTQYSCVCVSTVLKTNKFKSSQSLTSPALSSARTHPAVGRKVHRSGALGVRQLITCVTNTGGTLHASRPCPQPQVRGNGVVMYLQGEDNMVCALLTAGLSAWLRAPLQSWMDGWVD
jgi:hypothetical protein